MSHPFHRYFVTPYVIGISATLVVLLVLLGDLVSVFAFLFLSIVCTAGIGLLFWAVVWWLLGFIILLFSDALSNAIAARAARGSGPVQAAANKGETGTKERPKVKRAVVQYIQSAQRAGLGSSTIHMELLEHGWSDTEISDALEFVSSASHHQGPS